MPGRALFDLTDKIAVVTGANGGLGQALCDGFSAVGANVIAVDVAAHSAVPSRVERYHQGDLSSPDAVAELDNVISREHGDVDILVNAAGIARESDALDMSVDDWDDVFAVNARGLFLTSQLFGRRMAKRGRGKIVNFASRCAYLGYPKFVSYNASKASVVSITHSMAVELAPHGVNVNAVSPGFITTPMTAYVKADADRYASLTSRIPMGRFGEPEEIVGTVVFLSSSASDYLTGVVIPIDGGMMAY